MKLYSYRRQRCSRGALAQTLGVGILSRGRGGFVPVVMHSEYQTALVRLLPTEVGGQARFFLWDNVCLIGSK